jgi:hypothetical protein
MNLGSKTHERPGIQRVMRRPSWKDRSPVSPVPDRPTTVTHRLTSLGADPAPFFYHQRIRLERYDIEWRMDAPDMNTSAPARKQEVRERIAWLEESQG